MWIVEGPCQFFFPHGPIIEKLPYLPLPPPQPKRNLMAHPVVACKNNRPSSLPARIDATRAGSEEGRLF